ncbi:hypothetical protein GGR42_000072 [Saonia flava]|uniref:Amidohydrolase-related domain-containing protein n=1 Tax=Saonia flava TaxID=523696 RepID=A0A846QRK1_9FLAO|nr:amidohydrolase family protein [Saonia flava]NJB69610.1 hypothetical protein [Saonia flava]
MRKLVLGAMCWSLWMNALAQAYKGPIIDMHIHAYNQEAGASMFGIDYRNPLTDDEFKGVRGPEQQKKETLKILEQNNVVKAMISDGKLWRTEDPNRVIISGRNVSADSLRKRHQQGKLDAIGEIVSFYGGMTADDPLLAPYFDLAEELNIPIGYHMLPGGPPGGIYYMGLKDVRVANANPLQIEEVLIRHPQMKIYLAHGGWPYLEDMKALMYAHPHLYVELGAISWILPRAEFHNYLKGLTDAGFGKRIMFGTDQMVWPSTIEKAIEGVNRAEFLTMEQKEDIFYNNAANFLGLNEEEITKHKNSYKH